jgi:hypothetical protein
MQYSIIRNNQTFDPYDSAIQLYVNDGKILLQDKMLQTMVKIYLLEMFFKTNKLKYRIKIALFLVQSLGLNLLLPKDSISYKKLKKIIVEAAQKTQ